MSVSRFFLEDVLYKYTHRQQTLEHKKSIDGGLDFNNGTLGEL